MFFKKTNIIRKPIAYASYEKKNKYWQIDRYKISKKISNIWKIKRINMYIYIIEI